MSTTPTVTPINIQSEVAALAHKHVSVTYAVLGSLLLIVALMGFGGYLELKSFDTQLARAEAREAAYDADRKAWQTTMVQHDAERTAQATQIAQLEAQIAQRSAKPLPPAVQAALKPDATAQTVAFGVTEAYKGDSSFGQVTASPDSQVLLSVSQGQAVVVSKTSGDQAKADLKDEKVIVSLQSVSIGTLNTDLNGCKQTVSEANKVIESYKKAAKKSKFRKVLDGAQKVALFMGGVYLGKKI